MLSSIRKRSGSFIVKGFLLLLVLSFGMWGIQDMVAPSLSGKPVAEVGGDEISPRRVEIATQNQISRLRQVFGPGFNREQAFAMGIYDRVLRQEINTELLRKGAEDLGVSISDNLVSDNIRNDPNFRSASAETGFDRQRFRQILLSSGLSEAAYIAETRRRMELGQFLGAVQGGAIAPKPLVSAIYKFRNEKRVAEYVDLKPSLVKKTFSPSAQDLKAYHKDNAKLFTAPEYRKVTFVWMRVDDLAKETVVDEASIESTYQDRLDEFTVKGKRQVSQLLLENEDDANKAYALLAKGENFQKVGKAIAKQDEAILDFGEVTKEDLLPELATPAFQLTEDGYTQPVKTVLGWHILKISNIKPGGTQPLSEVRGKIRDELARQKAADALFDLSNRFEDELGGGATLEAAGQSLGLNAVTIDNIDRNGLDPLARKVTGTPGKLFIDTVFSTNEGEDSALTESGDDGFFLLRVDKITAPRLKPFASVEQDVRDAWTADQLMKELEKMAKNAVNRVNQGELLGRVADSLSVDVQVSGELERNPGENAKLAPAVLQKLFELKQGTAGMAKSANGFTVVVAKRVIAADPLADTAGFKALQQELTGGMQSSIIDELIVALQKDIPVTINRDQLSLLALGNQQR